MNRKKFLNGISLRMSDERYSSSGGIVDNVFQFHATSYLGMLCEYKLTIRAALVLAGCGLGRFTFAPRAGAHIAVVHQPGALTQPHPFWVRFAGAGG